MGQSASRSRPLGACDERIGRAGDDELLGHPTTCPHGNPIPGSDFEQADVIALSDAEIGVPVVMRGA